MLAGLAGRQVQHALHLVLVGGLMAVLGLEIAKRLTPLRGPALVAVGALVGLRAGMFYAKATAFRLWLRYALPAPIVFLLVFLLVSPVAELIRSAPTSAAPPAVAAQSAGGAPVVFILLDELPMRSLLDHTGQIDRRLYPNFAKLASHSTWYRNATGVAGMTRWAMPAMFTGRYPAKDMAPTASRYPNNLFTLLGGSGYDMRVFEGISQLCPQGTCAIKRTTAGGGQGGFRRVARDSAELWTEMSSPQDSTVDPLATLDEDTVDLNDQAAVSAPEAKEDPTWVRRPASLDGFLSALRPTGGPSMHFLHILLPHQPWKYLPSGLKYPERSVGQGTLISGRWTTETWPVQSTHQRHLMQAAYTDRLLGTMVKQMRKTGLYDRSLLVVTADHGLAFTPGEEARASITQGTASDVMWVPLFIKRPGQQDASVNDVNIEHVDLLPTISRNGWAEGSLGDRRRFVGRSVQAHARAYREVVLPEAGEPSTCSRDPATRAVAPRPLGPDRPRRPDDYLGLVPGSGPTPTWSADGSGTSPSAAAAGRPASSGSMTIAGSTYPPASSRPRSAGQLTSLATGLPVRPAVAVALNGVIGGMSETFTSGDDPTIWFTTMVSDSLMRRGENRLQLFLVDTTSGTRRLRPLALTS